MMSCSIDIEITFDYYSEFTAELEQILRHKWLESEKAKRDIGFEKALMDWAINYRIDWRRYRRMELQLASL